MREILFRGKDFSGVINHSWCFGSLDTTEDDSVRYAMDNFYDYEIEVIGNIYDNKLEDF